MPIAEHTRLIWADNDLLRKDKKVVSPLQCDKNDYRGVLAREDSRRWRVAHFKPFPWLEWGSSPFRKERGSIGHPILWVIQA